MVRSSELIRVWKHDPYSEAICHEFVDNMRLVSSYARQEDIPMITGASSKIVDYIRESVRENVLGDRVFFLGVEKQNHALSSYINEQLLKHQSIRHVPSIASQPQVTQQQQQVSSPPPPIPKPVPQPVPPISQKIEVAPVNPAPVVPTPMVQTPMSPPISSEPQAPVPSAVVVPEVPKTPRHDYDMPTIATQDVTNRFADTVLDTTAGAIENSSANPTANSAISSITDPAAQPPQSSSLDEYAVVSESTLPQTSMLSQPIEENYETLGVLIVELFGVPYALPSDEVLLVIEDGMAQCHLVDGHVHLSYQNRDYQYTMLSHVLFQEPLIAPKDNHKLVLLKSNNQIICLCVDSVVGFEIIDMKSVIEAPPESYFSGAGFNEYIQSVNVLDIHHMIAFVNSQHELSDIDAAIFNASNNQGANEVIAPVAPTVPTLSAAAESPLVNYAEDDGGGVTPPHIEIESSQALATEDGEPDEQQVVQSNQNHGVVIFGNSGTRLNAQTNKPRFKLSAQSGKPGAPDDRKENLRSIDSNQEGIETLFINTAQDVFSQFQSFVTKSDKAPDWRLSLIQGNLSTVDILEAYDVVVIDSKKGDTVNMDMLTFIRGDLRYRRFPVIVSTHLSSDVFKQRAYLLGANYVLKKPYTHEQLLEVIKLVASQVTVVEDIYDD